jgi:hypothetical protein
MKGDFSRETFDPKKHYSGVLMQQGRVQVDADWNEQQGIHQHRIETETRDVIGACGASIQNAGFQITVEEDGKTLRISRGRYYVDGILCENESDVAYGAQPDLPNPPDAISVLTNANTTAAFVYLDVWRRHVTALDDPLIREVALGGPDTTTRSKTVRQVKVLPLQLPSSGLVSCGDPFPEWDNLIKPSSGALSARSQPTTSTDNPCLPPPRAGYRRPENQLYRIEIHKEGALGTATLKWSRDNGTVVTAIEAISGREVTVHDVGRDEILGFPNGQWVEIIDDGQELTGQPGQLIQVDTVNPATRVITLKSAPAPVDLTRHPKLRRWDSEGEIPVEVPASNEGRIPLEDGIEVKFEAGTYKTGDYWLIPARTVTGDIEWPFTSPQPPFGILHHYCRLALLRLSDNTLSIQDCRQLFSPLAEVIPALHVTGINGVNDDILLQGLEQLNSNGLQVFLDGIPIQPPLESCPAIMIVTLEMPVVASTDPLVRVQGSVILNGDIQFPSLNTMQWKPAQGGAELSQLVVLLVNQQVSRIRMRVSLKGHAIWSEQARQRLYLDGRTLGQPGLRVDNTPRIDLAFPSGENRRASDFDSWFYVQLQLPEPSLVSVLLDPTTVIAGRSAVGTVLLDHPALGDGAQVTLSSSDSSVASVPGPMTILVPAGQTQATFTVTTTTAPPNSRDIVITATFKDVPQTARLRVEVVSVTISPERVTLFLGSGQQFTAAVTGTNNIAVVWSVQEPGGGSINTTGLYVAPSVLPALQTTFHVVASSVADPTKKAIATVNLTLAFPPRAEGI